MDELARFNKDRWEALAQAGIEYSKPMLDLDADKARQLVDPHQLLGDVTGKSVLCLASGGGQQSAAFGLLGANVTVFDLSETQLERDREAATHYGLTVRTVQGDMRDLSLFDTDEFDIVWQAFSINFVPDVRPVLAEAVRVLRPGGFFRIDFANPFTMSIDERDWNGSGYPLKRVYSDGEVTCDDDHWDVWQENGAVVRVPGPREFCHTLSTMINAMVANGLIIIGMWEVESAEIDPEPGTWAHFMAVAPPWLRIWCRLQ